MSLTPPSPLRQPPGPTPGPRTPRPGTSLRAISEVIGGGLISFPCIRRQFARAGPPIICARPSIRARMPPRAAAKGKARAKGEAKAKALGARASPPRVHAPPGLGHITKVLRAMRTAQPSLLALVKSGHIHADTYSTVAAAHGHLSVILTRLMKERQAEMRHRQERAKQVRSDMGKYTRRVARASLVADCFGLPAPPVVLALTDGRPDPS